MAYVVVAYVVMAYAVMAYVVVAYVVMAFGVAPLDEHRRIGGIGLDNYDLCSYGIGGIVAGAELERVDAILV